jgi:hypothetical protein
VKGVSLFLDFMSIIEFVGFGSVSYLPVFVSGMFSLYTLIRTILVVR